MFGATQKQTNPTTTTLNLGTTANTSAFSLPANQNKKQSEKRPSINENWQINKQKNLGLNGLKANTQIDQIKQNTTTVQDISATQANDKQSNPPKQVGGTLKVFESKQKKGKQSINQKIFNFLNIQDIIQNLTEGTPISQKQLTKITGNFSAIIESKTKKPDVKDKDGNLQLQELKCLPTSEQKRVVTLFWENVIEQLVSKNKVLCKFACLQAVKIHVRWNKEKYIDNGKFNGKIFPKDVFQEINSKMMINRRSSFFTQVIIALQDLFLTYFKGMKIIFHEISKIKSKRSNQNQALNNLTDKNQNQTITSLLQSFQNAVQKTTEIKQKYSYVLQNIFDCILSFSETFPTKLMPEHILTLINTMQDSSQMFNGPSLDSSLKNNLQRVIVRSLMCFPFQPETWTEEIRRKIAYTKLDIIRPFNLIILNEGVDSQSIEMCSNIAGENWIYLVNYLLQNASINQDLSRFIFSLICRILTDKSNSFWARTSQFQSINKYLLRLGQIANSADIIRNSNKIQVYQLIRVMICLMGKTNEQKKLVAQYPLSLVSQNTYKVLVDFSGFLGISNKKLFQQFLRTEYQDYLQNCSSDVYDEDNESFKLSKLTIIEFYSKLLISEPSYFSQLFVDEQDQAQFIHIVLKLITTNNTNNYFNYILFGALDSMINNEDSKEFVLNGINLLSQEENCTARIYQWCQNAFKVQCLTRHAMNLIQSDWSHEEWTQHVLKCLFILSKKMSPSSLGCYSKLLSLIFTNVVCGKINLQTSKKLHHLVNFDFALQYIQYILNFRFNPSQKCYTNKLLKSDNLKKLFQGISFINSLLLLNSQGNQQSKKQFQFLPQSIKRNLVLNNIEGQFQLTTEDNEFTSYLIGYLVIILNLNPQKMQKIGKICPDFSGLLYEGLYLLTKTYDQNSILPLFNIYNSFTLSNGAVQNKQPAFLQKFKNHAWQYESTQALQILLLSNLCDFAFARQIVDKVRVKLQNRRLFQFISNQKKVKILSCLSRYFYYCVQNTSNISVKNSQKQEYKQIQDHQQYLLQTLVNYSSLFFNDKGKNKKFVQNILSNIYMAFLHLQCNNRTLYVKWIKNYHRLLLNRVNFKQKNSYQENNGTSQTFYPFSQEYFKICQMFLCSSEYLNQKQYMEIIKIQTLHKSLSGFIFCILQQSSFQVMSQGIIQLTLQLVINALKMYYQIKIQRPVLKVLNQIWKLVQQKKHYFRTQQNFNVLQLLLYVYLQKQFNPQQINYQQTYWPLKLNNTFLDKLTLSKTFDMLKNPKHKIFFISGCNTISKYITESQYDWRTNDYLQRMLCLLRNSLTKPKQKYSSYQTIWGLQFLQLISLKEQKYEYELASRYAKFIFSEEYVLKRLGFLIKKLNVFQKGKQITWMSQKMNGNNYYQEHQNFSFAEKLQLCQFLKLINFLLVNSKWINDYAQEFKMFIDSISSSSHLFLMLLTSQTKIQATTQQQKKGQNTLIEANISSGSMIESGIRRFEKQTINSAFSRIGNYLQLMHSIMNIQLTSQYILTILSIQNLEKHPILLYTPYSERSWSNQICMKLLQTLSSQYISLKQTSQYINPILTNFTDKFYTKSLNLAQEMYFTNSKNLTTYLSTSPQQFSDLIKTDLQLLFQAVYQNLKCMKANLHKEYQSDSKMLNNIINRMKRELPSKNHQSLSDFQFSKYLGLDDMKSRNTMMKNIIKTRTARTINNRSQPGQDSCRMSNI